MPDSLKVIFFDAVGTLIRVREPVGRTYARIASAHGFAVDETMMGNAFRAAWQNLPQPQHNGALPADDDRGWWREMVTQTITIATGQPPNAEQVDPCFADLYSHYASPDAWSVFEDVQPALAQLTARYPLFVLSNFDKRLRAILAGHGLAEFLSGMIISSEVGASKPHRLIFAAAVRAAGCVARECLHVGDDEILDVRGAKGAGLWAFHIQRPRCGLNVLVQMVAAGHFRACSPGVHE